MASTTKGTSLNKQCAILQPFGDDAKGKPLLLQDIETFQKEESKILKKMQKILSKPTKTSAEQKQLKNLDAQLKPIQNSRMKLLQQLTYAASSSQCSLSGDRRALQDQLAMLMIAEDQLKMMEKQTQQLINSKNSKHRMVQITNYENDRFASHAGIFKTIAFCSLFILGGVYLKGMGWNNIGTTIIILSIAIAIFLTIKRIWWNYWRSSMNWNQFEWDVDVKGGSKHASVWEVDKRFFDKGYDAAAAEASTLASSAGKDYEKVKNEAKKATHDVENDINNDYSKASFGISKAKGASKSESFATFN
tara:strand:- start:992 stop:1906 length:915 start_codon:yes stop_codon:yes gene_type:complete